MAHTLTPEKEAILRREWPRTNMRMPELKAALDCCDHTVRRFANQLGLGPRPNAIWQWSPERVEELFKLYHDGLSASQIALKLGHGVTRNAVIGQLARRLPSDQVRARPTAPATRTPKSAGERAPKSTTRPQAKVFGETRAPKPKLIIAGNGAVIEKPDGRAPHAPMPKPSAWEPLPGVEPVAREVAGAHVCKWPITVDGDELSHCCGAVATEQSYCASHARRAAGPAQTKKIKPPQDFSIIASSRRFAA